MTLAVSIHLEHGISIGITDYDHVWIDRDDQTITIPVALAAQVAHIIQGYADLYATPDTCICHGGYWDPTCPDHKDAVEREAAPRLARLASMRRWHTHEDTDPADCPVCGPTPDVLAHEATSQAEPD